jgi:hypothetical protein
MARQNTGEALEACLPGASTRAQPSITRLILSMRTGTQTPSVAIALTISRTCAGSAGRVSVPAAEDIDVSVEKLQLRQEIIARPDHARHLVRCCQGSTAALAFRPKLLGQSSSHDPYSWTGSTSPSIALSVAL